MMGAGATIARKLPSPVTQKALIDLARSLDRPQDQRMVALYALRGIKAQPVLLMWVDLVNDPVDEVSVQAANALNQVHDPDPVPALLQTIEKKNIPENSQRRAAAFNTLCQLADKRALPAFKAALQSKDAQIRSQGLNGLIALKDESSREVVWELFRALPEPPLGNTHAPEHIALIQLVSKIKERRAATTLLAWLDSTNPGVRYQIAEALPNVCGKEEAPALAQALEMEFVRFQRGDQTARQVLTQCVRSLGQVPCKESAKALLGLLEKCFDQQLAIYTVQQLTGVAVPEMAADLVRAHSRAYDANVRRELENLLKNGKFDVHWVERDKGFQLGPPKIEVEQ